MSKRNNGSRIGTMLDLWRPPQGAGDPVGCLATTYTFSPGLFEEQCLARFLEIDSVPHREDLAFLLERETRLGSIYAGVLVDHTQAGKEHSLRWDVLPIRVPVGKQHAKLSLLAWSHHLRIIVASANLTEPGYRTNQEVSAAVDLTPESTDPQILTDATAFLRSLILFLPGGADRPPEVRRAEDFLGQVERQAIGWKQHRRSGTVHQRLVFTLPSAGDRPVSSSLDEAIAACRRHGGSPNKAWVASPFFDTEKTAVTEVTKALCKQMARGQKREITVCVAADRQGEASVPRLAASKALLLTPRDYQASVIVRMLPERDSDKNCRPWHAKMLALFSDKYSALMIGSSNFTCFGMGVAKTPNIEANLITITNHLAYDRNAGQIVAVWPEMERVSDPDSAEWRPDLQKNEEEEQGEVQLLPAGFLSATYSAGEIRSILLRVDPVKLLTLPEAWSVHSCGRDEKDLLSSDAWRKIGNPSVSKIPWEPDQPPEGLLVRWSKHEAFLTFNIDDRGKLPPPAQLENISSDDMLRIIVTGRVGPVIKPPPGPPPPIDPDLDSATPIDLDPLRRYDLQATFLHRIRRRARILGQLRSHLERPVWGHQALEWRLRGLVGIEALADRMVREFIEANGKVDEALLALSDFLIVLGEVDYRESEGSLSKAAFEDVFRPFLNELSRKLGRQIEPYRDQLSGEVLTFWESVVKRCQD